MCEASLEPGRLGCAATGKTAPAEPGRAGKTSSLDRLAAQVNALMPRADAPPATRTRVLAAVTSVAAGIDAVDCDGRSAGYTRCVLHEDPAGWSLAAIAFRPGQSTPPHDHAGWGGAVTVRGVERDRRFAGDRGNDLVLIDERDYAPGTGYLFDADDVHQPVGADPTGTTVSLHLLVHPAHDRRQHHHETAAGHRAQPAAA
jgi:predicted metal-dependent enzyme (double-stranded beta helix superfamily)